MTALTATVGTKADTSSVNSALALKADSSAMTAALAGKSNVGHTHSQADITGLTAALAGKSDVGHGHSIADITGLAAAIANIGKLYVSGVLKSAFPIAVTATAGASSVVFYLTNDGTATGTALFPTNVYLETLMLRPEESSAPLSFGTPVLSNSNRTLTIPCAKIASVLGILTLGQSAAGTPVKALVFGN